MSNYDILSFFLLTKFVIFISRLILCGFSNQTKVTKKPCIKVLFFIFYFLIPKKTDTGSKLEYIRRDPTIMDRVVNS